MKPTLDSIDVPKNNTEASNTMATQSSKTGPNKVKADNTQAQRHHDHTNDGKSNAKVRGIQ